MVRREAPPPGEISRGQGTKSAQNVQVLPARLPHSSMAFTSEQVLVQMLYCWIAMAQAHVPV